MGYIIFLFFATSPRRREIAYARYWASVSLLFHQQHNLWCFFFTNAICEPFFQHQRDMWAFFSQAFFFTNAICEPFFQQQRDLWCHCFAVTNSGLTSPDPLLTSTDKWRFCLTGIKRISKQARHSSGMAGECRNWLRLRFGLQYSSQVPHQPSKAPRLRVGWETRLPAVGLLWVAIAAALVVIGLDKRSRAAIFGCTHHQAISLFGQ